MNEKIAKLDDGSNVHYLDIGKAFLNEDGTISNEIMPDYLHLSQKGYRIWADAMEPTLWSMLDEPQVNGSRAEEIRRLELGQARPTWPVRLRTDEPSSRAWASPGAAGSPRRASGPSGVVILILSGEPGTIAQAMAQGLDELAVVGDMALRLASARRTPCRAGFARRLAASGPGRGPRAARSRS